jgi:hypothetical protein
MSTTSSNNGDLNSNTNTSISKRKQVQPNRVPKFRQNQQQNQLPQNQQQNQLPPNAQSSERQVDQMQQMEQMMKMQQMQKLFKQQPSVKVVSSNERDDEKDYNDELDEDFEDELAKKTSIEQLERTVESFDQPEGLEDSKESPVLNGPQVDLRELERLKDKINKMPRDKLQEFLKSMALANKVELGKNDFSAVSDDHRKDASKSLKEKIAEKQLKRKSKISRTREMDNEQKKNTSLQRKDGKDGQDFDLEHVHDANCNHDHNHDHNHDPDQQNNNFRDILSNKQDQTHVHDVNCNHDHASTHDNDFHKNIVQKSSQKSNQKSNQKTAKSEKMN